MGLGAPGARASIEGLEEPQATPDGVTFVLSAPEGTGRIVREDGELPRLDVAGIPSICERGGWLLPARSVWVGIPREGGVEVSFDPLDRSPLRLDEGGGSQLPLGLLGRGSVEVGPPSWIRNQRVVAVTWIPLVPAAGDAAWEGGVRIRLRFQGARDAAPAPVGRDSWEQLYADLLVNYEQARSWRRAGIARPRARGDSFSTTDNPWFRIEVASHGVYAIEGADLQAAGLGDLSQIVPEKLRLFTGSGLSLPEDASVADVPAWLNEIAIHLDGMNDGRFEPQDKILFRGLGPDGWYGEFGQPDHAYERYRTDEFSSVNTYWLSWGDFTGEALRWTESAGLPVPDPILTEARARIHYERNQIWDPTPSEMSTGSAPYPSNLPAWERWYWLQVIATSRETRSRIDFTVPDPVSGSTGRFLARVWGASWDFSTTFRDHYARLIIGSDSVEVSWDDKVHRDLVLQDLPLEGEEHELILTAPYKSDPNPNVFRQDRWYLAWFEVDYQRKLVARGDSLDFVVDPGSSRRGFAVSGISDTAATAILDVTDPLMPRPIAPAWEREGNFHRAIFGVDPLASAERRIAVVNLDAARTPRITIDAPPPAGYLRDRRDAVDYILITHASYGEAAEILASWRREHSGEGNGFRVAIVDVQDIYDEFSAGRLDPTAIRNFLRVAFEQWNGGDPSAAPAYVLLLGDTTFDFRDRLKQGAWVTVPTYEGFYDASLMRTVYSPQFASDDWFVLYDPFPDPSLDMAIGRLPADTPARALAMVEKVRNYESTQDTGSWRQRATLVADDVCQGLRCDYPLMFTHTRQTEALADDVLPVGLERDRVYLYEYGNECIYDRKPVAAAALRKSIDDGTLIVNYTGHGSEVQLADEKILEPSGVASMTNADRLFFFLTASCSVGKFDFAGEGLSEALVRRPGGGAIAALSATAVAYSPSNAELNRQFFLGTFPDRDFARSRPLGEALVRAKIVMGAFSALNNRRYPLLGDPAVRLSATPSSIRMQVETVRAAGAVAPDTLMRGARVVLRGQVVDGAGSIIDDFRGAVNLRVYDAEIRRDETADCRESRFQATYNLTGAAILRQTAAVENGRFEISFVTPAVLRSGVRGWGQIYGYALSEDGRSASGGLDSLVVTENQPLLADDGEGPRIVLTPEGDPEQLASGALWRAVLSDSSGINITQLVSNRSVIMQIAEGTRLAHVEDLSDSVRFSEGYAEGHLRFRLPEGLAGGRRYRLTLSASDNLNQGGSASADFYLVEGAGSGLTLDRVFNVPNPTEGATTFFVEMSQQAEITIRVFTVGGRTIRELLPGTLTPSEGLEKGIYWDGRDAEGASLANGVYFYKVSIRGRNGEKRDRVERLAVLR